MSRSISTLRRRNLHGLIVTILIALAATAVINLVIDPYGTFRLFDIRGLNRIKPYPDHDIETIKARALHHVKPDALILGNSRAEVGFDPTHPAWREAGYQSVYNAGIPGSFPSSAWYLLQEAAQTKPPKFVLLCIDFFDFPIAPNFKPVPPKTNTKPWLENTRWMLYATLTMQSLIDSATTLRRQYQKNPEQLTTLGHNPLLEYVDFAREDGYWVLFRKRAEDNASNHSRKPKNLYLQGTQSSPRFDDIRQMVRWATQNKAELQLIIYPYHAQLLVLIDELGLWPLFEEWKRQIAGIIEEETGNTQSRVTLIDFSGLSKYATEAVPPKNDKKTATRWYWEAGHFKKELGDQMLNEILLPTSKPSPNPFGKKLTQENISLHNIALRKEMDTFQVSDTKVVSEIKEIVQQSAGRKMPE